ncbi:conserved Plasmodium protein, unknown function [Plasmodium ovale]|uniref:Alpha/beta hydrolase n=1 Tax=Plasmodium ovale TaxID=36330 RepID=A0A1D3TL77_PLAOA|nr:conserved Plasmodium protein, unknown function [Plasmodium ovale]
MFTIMFFKKIFKSFKKNSSLIFFFITLLYLFYTYVSLFLFIFNNALFYLFVNISLFYLCFHFIVRALAYPGSLFLYLHKTNYDNKVRLCKFYMKESAKLLFILNDIRENVKEIPKEDVNNSGSENVKIKLEKLFSDSNSKDNYFNFFSSLHILYTLYISYYLYINLEENVEFSNEQLNFYYYLKLFMTRINEIEIYINKEDIIYPEILTEIKIHKDINKSVDKFITKKNHIYRKNGDNKLKKEKKSIFHYSKWVLFNFRNYLFKFKKTYGIVVSEEKQKLLRENDNKNGKGRKCINAYNTIPHSSYYKKKEQTISCKEESRKKCKGDNSNQNGESELKNNINSVEKIPSNYVHMSILSLFYHENYEKSITHVNYKNFFMVLKSQEFLKLLDELSFFLKKLGDMLKVNTLKEKMELKKFPSFINNFVKNYIAGTMDLFKYELVYKYYGKQQYLHVNNTKLDCMFIPCKKFLNDKMKKYINLKKSGKFVNIQENIPNNNFIFLNAFNNDFYNYIYHDDYLYDVPLVLYFNPNGAYYELNACYSGVLKFYLENNVNVFVYNYRGYSKSGGYPNLNRNNLDALKIAEFLLSKKVKHLGLHGTSIGGPLCSYVSYHLCNFNKKNNNTEIMDKLYKNEIHIKITYKQMNKTIRLMNRKKDKILNILLIPFKYIILLLQFIVLCKLKISSYRMKNKMNLSNVQRKDLINRSSTIEKCKISFICIDKSFYNFEEVAKYMVGEYAYNILQFTSYKLDITKYYMNSNIPKILIYDNDDEIIHYMSNVVTGVSKEISKLYKSGNKILMNSQKSKPVHEEHEAAGSRDSYESWDDLLPLLLDDAHKRDAGEESSSGKKDSGEGGAFENGNSSGDGVSNAGSRGLHLSKEKPSFVDTLIIDEYVDSSWFENKLKNIDFRLFLQSWKVLNDCILFLNKSSTTNNSFISIGLETYKSIMSLYNSKENELEKETHNAIYCIYNDNMSFMNSFKKVNSNYDDFIIMECINNDQNFKKTNIYDMLKENEDFKIEMEKLNKILRDIYMSKRKEVEKVHFTYSGFFLKDDYLYDYINTENRNNEEPAFNIEDMDIIHFLNEFSDSINEILHVINYNINSCGQLFNELNKVSEKEKVTFLKSFFFRMKVYGSYPSQCFISSNHKEFCNSFSQIPFILSQYCDKSVSVNMDKMKDKTFYLNNDTVKLSSERSSSSMDSEDTLLFIDDNVDEKKGGNKKTKIEDDFKKNDKIAYNFYDDFSTPYVTIKKSMLLHDLIICLDYFKKGNSSNSFPIFYKLDHSTYLIDIKQFISFLKDNNVSSSVPLTCSNFLDLFSNDIGVDVNNVQFPNELEKYVSWMRLNSRMNICKICLSLRNELNKMKHYSEGLIVEYTTINQNTNIHFIIFLIYRILIFKKILTHTYIIYTFFQRLNNSLDITSNQHEEGGNIDIKSLEPISRFNIFYKDAYKIYSPRALGLPLMVNCGHNGSLNKEDLSFFNICLNFLLKEYV